MCHPLDFHAYAGTIANNLHLPYALSTNFDICDTLSEWHGADAPGLMAWSDSLENWMNANERFITLRFQLNDQLYFGWARFNVTAGSTSFTVLDYAYEASSSLRISTDQSLDYLPFELNVFPNPASDQF